MPVRVSDKPDAGQKEKSATTPMKSKSKSSVNVKNNCAICLQLIVEERMKTFSVKETASNGYILAVPA